MISVQPSKNLIEKSRPSSSEASLIVVLIDLFSLFTPGPLLNDNSENTDDDSLPSRNNECNAYPTYFPPDPLTPPSVPTQKLNMPVTLPLHDAVRDKEVGTVIEAS